MVIIQKKITKIKRENKKHCEKLRQIMRNIFRIMFYGKVNTKNTKHRKNCTNYEKYLGKKNKSSGSGSIGMAANHRSLTSAIPLLTHTETLGCWVSPLARSASP